MTQKNESNYLLVKALLEGGGKGYYLLFWYYLMETDMKVRFSDSNTYYNTNVSHHRDRTA